MGPKLTRKYPPWDSTWDSWNYGSRISIRWPGKEERRRVSHVRISRSGCGADHSDQDVHLYLVFTNLLQSLPFYLIKNLVSFRELVLQNASWKILFFIYFNNIYTSNLRIHGSSPVNCKTKKNQQYWNNTCLWIIYICSISPLNLSTLCGDE